MPRFRHRRTGRNYHVSYGQYQLYRGSNFERLPDDDQVPVGTADDILAWVGSDETRRAAALTAEQAGKNRKTLITKLGG